MDELFEGSRTRIVPQHRPTSPDLIFQARALRYQWYDLVLARQAARLGRLPAEAVARPQPTPTETLTVSGRPRFSRRPVT